MTEPAHQLPESDAARDQAAAGGVRHHSISGLLVALILLVGVTPFVEDLPNGDVLEGLLFTLVLVAAVLAVGRDRRVLIIAAALLAPVITGKWLNHFHPNDVPATYFLGFGLIFIAFAIGRLLRFILGTKEVDTEVLSAGISIYLMLGLLWTLAYILVGQFSPGSFSVTDGAGASTRLDRFNAFYFSFGTLSTVGAPDVAPISKLARTLMVMEGVTGTLYLAILIARLVASYSPKPRPGHQQSSGPS
jgi:Ion channel